MKATDSKLYFNSLNELVDWYNNTYHHSIGKKPINADYSALSKKMWRILKLLSLKLIIDSQLLIIRIFSVQVVLKIGQDKYLLSILVWKIILGLIKLKI